ncbi:putative oxidoreductase [Pirellulimonas nuda]|uniref:Putative oxidoreductase n=1 Tax=Pirellulimonas nuda TaxID=2528009 RepID=A0A518D747_9BACT|nr:SDR family NAD(P)-dependent oxidoreductase [Pirellulimonas nuda]QDU87308.1 putative oxidoreductase [Pirellulimonas nuda]
MPDWTGKTALVTGGSAGLGLAIAGAIRRRGADVVLVARNQSQLAQACAGLPGAVALSADLAVGGEATRVVNETAARFGRLDLVVHAAGRSTRGRVVDTPREQFEALLALNTLAAIELAQAAAPSLVASRGSLVLIGSLATHVAPKFLGAYPVSKHPLAALAQQLRLELGPEGMHTLLVCPGPIARADSADRYADQAADLPPEARKPGGGAKVRALDPQRLAEQILAACDKRKAELVIPKKARLLFALSRLFPEWGDRLLNKKME